MTTLTVLIPTHGRQKLLRRTIESLAAYVLPEGYKETVVVENGTRQGAEAVVRQAAAARQHLQLRHMLVQRANKSYNLNAAAFQPSGASKTFPYRVVGRNKPLAGRF